MLATLLRTTLTAHGSVRRVDYDRYVGHSILVMAVLSILCRGSRSWSGVITNCRKLHISIKSTFCWYVMKYIPGEAQRGFG
jgi:hypothetical protein